MALNTTSGTTQVGHKEIAATGQARVHFATAVALGSVLIMLTITFMFAFYNGRDANGLLTLIGTLFGLATGILTGRHSG
jgi:hypothetical protein